MSTTSASQRQHQRPFSLRWLTGALLSAVILSTGAQAACISLQNSTACPSYKAFWVDVSVAATVDSYGIVMSAFTTVEGFDAAVNNATGFETSTDCTGYNKTVRIPYQNTVLCSIAVQEDASYKCKSQSSDNSNMCDSSCTLYQQGLSAMITTLCPKATTALSQLSDLTTICSRKATSSWPGLQDNTTSCINSLQNEALTCGLGSTTNMCTYCKTNITDSCCSNAAATCKYPTTISSTTATSTSTGFVSLPSATSGGGDSTSSGTGMSTKTLASIIGGSIGGVIVIAFLLIVCIRRANRTTAAKGGSTLARQMSNASDRYKISNPKLLDDGFIPAAPIPMTTLPPLAKGSAAFGVAAEGTTVVAGREATGKQSYCQALYPYQSSMADELDLTPGDIVNVQRVFDDGWAVGVNMNTSKEGAFPVVCVMFVDESVLDDDFEDVNMHSMTPMTLREEDREGRRSPSGRNSPRSSLPSRSSSPVHLPRRNSSIRDSTASIPGLGGNGMTSSPLAGGNNAGSNNGQGRATTPVMRDTMMSDASSINRWWEGERRG